MKKEKIMGGICSKCQDVEVDNDEPKQVKGKQEDKLLANGRSRTLSANFFQSVIQDKDELRRKCKSDGLYYQQQLHKKDETDQNNMLFEHGIDLKSKREISIRNLKEGIIDLLKKGVSHKLCK
jgi:hypothetical protein